MKFTIIGCGVLGGAILEALVAKKVLKPEDIIIVEMYPNPATDKFKGLGAILHTQIKQLTGPQEHVLLAVKPQQSKTAMEDLKHYVIIVTPKTLVMSIMAGVTIATISNYLGKAQIIRIMPNTPCQIQIGMCGYYGTQEVTEESFKICDQMLSCMGKVIRLKSEEQLDPITAVSGSGPAYVFYLAEAMEDAAKQFGFNEQEAKLLAMQTLLGAATLLSTSPDSAAELRKKVTSPGGTTQAAIASFDSNKIKDLLVVGINAARLRSIELSKM